MFSSTKMLILLSRAASKTAAFDHNSVFLMGLLKPHMVRKMAAKSISFRTYSTGTLSNDAADAAEDADDGDNVNEFNHSTLIKKPAINWHHFFQKSETKDAMDSDSFPEVKAKDLEPSLKLYDWRVLKQEALGDLVQCELDDLEDSYKMHLKLKTEAIEKKKMFEEMSHADLKALYSEEQVSDGKKKVKYRAEKYRSSKIQECNEIEELHRDNVICAEKCMSGIKSSGTDELMDYLGVAVDFHQEMLEVERKMEVQEILEPSKYQRLDSWITKDEYSKQQNELLQNLGNISEELHRLLDTHLVERIYFVHGRIQSIVGKANLPKRKFSVHYCNDGIVEVEI